MELKSIIVSAVCGTMAFAATAQSHHGYYWAPSETDLEGYNEAATTKNSLGAWFLPELVMPMVEDAYLLSESNIYKDNKTDLIARASTVATNAANITGAHLDATLQGQYISVTIPSKLQYPEEAEFTGTDGVMLFHLVLGKEPSRINDAANTLSYTGGRAYLSDCTGAYLGVKAPAGVEVKLFLSTPNISNKTLAGYDNYDDQMHTMVFDFGKLASDDYVELTSGAPYNNLAGMYLITSKFDEGYCVKFVDIAFYGVKPGDVVGCGGLQTLHEGWTPKQMVDPSSISGVETISADANANAPVEYFNLQGIQVGADNATPGLYIRRQGTETTKVVVR
jgi:hypothetical protein